MDIERQDRRECKRLYFNKDAGITGIVLPSQTSDNSTPVTVNICAEGAELYLKRTDGETLDTRKRMTLEKIDGCQGLAFCSNIEFEIKRIVDIAPLDNILLGCQFHEVSTGVKNQINEFVMTELEKQK